VYSGLLGGEEASWPAFSCLLSYCGGFSGIPSHLLDFIFVLRNDCLFWRVAMKPLLIHKFFNILNIFWLIILQIFSYIQMFFNFIF
jgi:hypothetical protein